MLIFDCDAPEAHRQRAQVMGVAGLADAHSGYRFAFDFGALRIVPAAPGTPERISALQVAVGDPATVLAAAALQACQRDSADGGRFFLASVWFEPVAAG